MAFKVVRWQGHHFVVMKRVQNRALSKNELDNLGGLLALRLKDTNVFIYLQCHIGSDEEWMTLADARVNHVEWLTGESFNFKCTLSFGCKCNVSLYSEAACSRMRGVAIVFLWCS